MQSDVPLNEDQIDAENKARRFYASCIDKDGKIESLGAKPMLDLIRSLGGWTVGSSAGRWDPNKWDFQSTLEEVHLLGLSPFFDLTVAADLQNSTKNVLQVSNSLKNP